MIAAETPTLSRETERAAGDLLRAVRARIEEPGRSFVQAGDCRHGDCVGCVALKEGFDLNGFAYALGFPRADLAFHRWQHAASKAEVIARLDAALASAQEAG